MHWLLIVHLWAYPNIAVEDPNNPYPTFQSCQDEADAMNEAKGATAACVQGDDA